MIEVGYKTDKGITRSHNEDACIVLPEDNVYVIADGVGGNKAGELASKTAVNGVVDFVHKNPISELKSKEELSKYLTQCIKRINADILSLGENYPENKGMATTIIICYIQRGKAFFVNVGDSRVYLRRGKELFQVTEDHTYVNSLVKLGVISKDEVKGHQKEHVITRAMGAEKEVQADFYQTNLEEGDIILLCTDGLYGEIKEQDINELIAEEQNMKNLAIKLVDRANESGGRDNITTICIKYEEGGRNE